MTNTYHATPYDISASGFYFSTYDEYLLKAASHRNDYGQPVEEYEIQFIDGQNGELFGALQVNQANLTTWFDSFADMEGDDAVKAIYLAQYCGETMTELLPKIEDVVLIEGTAESYADEYLEDSGLLDEVPESLRFYIDTKALARDMLISGDITEVEISGTNYVVWGP